MLIFKLFIALLFSALFLVFCFQMYQYSITRLREKKQKACLALGIAFSTIGIVSLVYRNSVVIIIGLVLLMLGLRLIAHGLDRIDKKIFIDKYDEDQ